MMKSFEGTKVEQGKNGVPTFSLFLPISPYYSSLFLVFTYLSDNHIGIGTLEYQFAAHAMSFLPKI